MILKSESDKRIIVKGELNGKVLPFKHRNGKISKDLKNIKFGKLTPISFTFDERQGNIIIWLCKCDCGNFCYVPGKALLRKERRSCGCIQQERKRDAKDKRLYSIWDRMTQRCNNPKDPSYRWYGERGIKVCDEWMNDRKSFIKWSWENGYKDGLTIDRINPNGNYCPENCQWLSNQENAVKDRKKLYNVNGLPMDKKHLSLFLGHAKTYLCDLIREFGNDEAMLRIKEQLAKRGIYDFTF